MEPFFFEDETVQSTVEGHLNQVMRLEDAEAARVMKLYKKIRQELRDRLSYLDRGTFTAEKVRGTLVQVETAIRAMNENLKKGMGDSAGIAADKGIKDLVTEINTFNKHFKGAVIPMNLNAAVIATDTQNLLINKYDSSLDAYSQQVRSRITSSITESAIQQKSYSEVVNDLGNAFMGEEWKLHQIVRTELHNVYSQGKLRGMRELWGEGNGDIPDLKKTLFHPMDKRTGEDSKRLSQNNPIVPVDEPFVESSLGKTVSYMAPPNRPNDRAILVPYRDGWKK